MYGEQNQFYMCTYRTSSEQNQFYMCTYRTSSKWNLWLIASPSVQVKVSVSKYPGTLVLGGVLL